MTPACPSTRCSSPPTPPAQASTRLSVSSCRTMRPRPAPSVARIASSRDRDAARASIRFATLTHAISSTNPTTASIGTSSRALPLHAELAHRLEAHGLIRVAPSDTRPPARGRSCPSRCAPARTSTPGFSRADRDERIRACGLIAFGPAGRHPQLAADAEFERERRGITPTTTCAFESIWMVLPTIAGSAP